MDKKRMRRKNLLYRLRKKGVKVDTRERCVYLPYGSEPDNIAQVRRLLHLRQEVHRIRV